ncbi:hypothetical protein [Streptomyces scopuliridis]|uniref:hypothetical protein n=1 Tax=Streptomyces scopuliridis TaxID=452529 RepID=UPI00341F127B
MANPKRARAQAAAEASAAAKYRRKAYRDNRAPATRAPETVLGLREICWCGEPSGHDWPGRDDGTPHPRDDGASGARQ